MAKGHKDLPAGAQPWANEVDKAMARVTELEAIVRRLTENAGIDMSNPKRGINTGDAPNVGNPVGQKVSSLADVDTYNVLDAQVLSWSGKGQKWMPVTLPSAGGAVPIPMAYTNGGTVVGHGSLDEATSTWAYYGYNPSGTAEVWATDTVYVGAGNWDLGPVALVTATYDGFGRPSITLSAEDYADGTSSHMTVFSYGVRMNAPRFRGPVCTTAGRPTGLANNTDDIGSTVFDTTLGIPIYWSGTAWTNALGTTV